MAGLGKADAIGRTVQAGKAGAPRCRCLVEERGAAIHFLKVLAQDTRVKIVCSLMAHERSVGELATLASLHQSTVSQHLARLRQEGVVNSRRDGNAILYSIADQRVRSILLAVWEVKAADAA
jgi:ArsR family transcriptional regulator, virulence genes transcriptional regulator